MGVEGQGPSDRHRGVLLITALLTGFMSAEQRAALTAKYPKEMAEVAGLIAQSLPSDQLRGLSVTRHEPAESSIPIVGGSKRFTLVKSVASHIPLIRRFL